jgi:hypothetical protein
MAETLGRVLASRRPEIRKRRVVASRTSEPESAYAWWRLAASVALSTVGGVGMWCVVVALPAVQAEFGVTRADASLAYTLTMIGFAIGASSGSCGAAGASAIASSGNSSGATPNGMPRGRRKV